ncbi:MAG: adenylate/guanylate cyclase domain-containing protein [Deltaproteobacteria bacterium]|nr:adenylate/guanylate cyclase domain-containing protein [Deltaproteobacteria bacterium]
MTESGTETRRLQAIMFTDMLGFSRMMGEDEERCIRLVEEHRVIVRATLPAYGGREHQTIGDAFVVLFDSALNAVSCAVEIQKRLRERNADKPESDHVLIRIGIHLDDIVFKDGQIYGDGVNLAARVEPQAEAGGICITEPVLAHVQGKVTFAFVALGQRALKNIARPPALYAVHIEGSPRPSVNKVAAKKPASKLPLIAAAAAVVVVVVVVAFLGRGPRAVSADPVAAALYAEALTLQRDGQPGGAVQRWQDAVEKDATLAGAHLRMAALMFEVNPGMARDSYRAAARGRDRLDDKDAALLAAFAPYFAATIDMSAFMANMDRVAERFDDDDEVLFWQGYAHQMTGDHPGARAIVAKGRPTFLPLLWLDGIATLAMDGREDEGRAILDRCVASSSSSTKCLQELIRLHQRTGRCKDMETAARELGARAPDDPEADRLLAYALAAQDVPIASVVEVMLRAKRKFSAGAQPIADAIHRTRVYALGGAFSEAERSAQEWQHAVAQEPDIQLHASPASYLIAARIEQGRRDDAAAAAAEFLRRAPAFNKDAFGDDWSAFFENVLHVGGKLSVEELETNRVAWVEEQFAKDPRPDRLVHLWRDAWGEWARDPAQATLALKAYEGMKKRGLKVPSTGRLEAGLALAIGQTLLLTGDVHGSMEFLERSANACVDLVDPYRAVRAYWLLGEARGRNGDVDGARIAYKAVVDRWGATADKSVTLEAAQAGLAALTTTPPATPPTP